MEKLKWLQKFTNEEIVKHIGDKSGNERFKKKKE